jgi:hypothetical protein
MSNHFTLLEKEKSVNEAVGQEQIEMINRLIIFVNTRLDEIELLQTDLAKAKTDITSLQGKK